MTGYGRRRVLKVGGLAAVVGTLASRRTAADGTAGQVGSTDRGWTSRRGNPGHTGYAAGESGPDDPAVVDWEHTESGGSVAVSNGVVYRTTDGAVHAFDAADGERIAESDDVGADGTPTAVDDRVYVGGEDLTALENEGAEPVWQQGFESDAVSEPTVVDGRALVVSDGTLHAVDAAEGARLWAFEPDDGTLVDQPVAAADGAVFATDGRSLYAIEGDDGDVRWSTDDGGFREQVVLATDDVVAVQVGGVDEVAVYETETGDLRWIGDGYAATLATDDRIYTLTRDDIVGYDRESGEERWRPALESAVYGPPVADGETLYVGIRSANGGAGIVALALEDGTLEWSIRTDAHPHELALADDTLYAAAGGLLAIRSESAFDDVSANESESDNVSRPENRNDTFETRDPETAGVGTGNDSGSGEGSNGTEDADEVLGNDTDDEDEAVPGFTSGAGIAGGAVVLEWLRRSAAGDRLASAERK
ncbi:outer membrane protein assembly factor BamB family protein [Natronococcus jeotgali]|uniref:Pyrrolo-quinoline quinone beta-propeller repeat protein n=1 Tax=Natronococcus jeotgali DSM 18795 TaxID=1227498 RepID=L9XTV4_9EURY|nr:PQQ-binding-like beta-propeller repeat protein [Natronococcus jeotgali]ELY64028.1 pyrrolo-quinoline quinone beta-propeller repeat protein [Natronococcus jeotgali DSM 18795]